MRCTVIGALFLLSLISPATAQTPAQEIDNVAAFARLYGVVRYFYPSDAAAALDWNGFAVHGVNQVRRATSPEALDSALETLFTPLGPGIEIGSTLSAKQQNGAPDPKLVAWQHRGYGLSTASDIGPYRSRRTNRATNQSDNEPFAVPVSGAFVDVELTPGLRARVPLTLTETEAITKRVTVPAVGSDADTRLADVVVAWNVFRHFYPYFAEAGVDWDNRLRPHLELAQSADTTRSAHRDALRALVADARDGHGGVNEPVRPGQLPIQLRLMEGKPVVIGSTSPEVRVGAVVTAINGIDAATRALDEVRLASGSSQWKEWRAARALITCPVNATTTVTVDYPLEPARQVELQCSSTVAPPIDPRPDSVRELEPIKELEPGIWYVDLTRAPMTAITPVLSELAGARGVVFDLRGYPTDAGFKLMPHLLSARESARWMHQPRLAKPFGESDGWDSFGWDVEPAQPRVAANRIFLTDGRAISYAESIMGYVQDEKLGTILGGTTAGTNGNIAIFSVPGGFNVVFTAMRVTRHDGRSPFHMEGVKPDIAVEPTLSGLRAGKDEVLERALAVLRGAPAAR
jgi:hypothetical protein